MSIGTPKNLSTEKMRTSSEVIESLKAKGYTTDFSLKEKGLSCRSSKEIIPPADFRVDSTYRFEGESNPSDEEIVYAISVPSQNLKGVLISGYNAYAEPMSAELLKKLKT